MTRAPTPSPTYSPDGHWWWDGHVWQPVATESGQTPASTPAQPPPEASKPSGKKLLAAGGVALSIAGGSIGFLSQNGAFQGLFTPPAQPSSFQIVATDWAGTSCTVADGCAVQATVKNNGGSLGSTTVVITLHDSHGNELAHCSDTTNDIAPGDEGSMSCQANSPVLAQYVATHYEIPRNLTADVK